MDDGVAVGEIGRRLGEIRASAGLSLQTVADRAGFSRSYISQIQRGEKPVDKRSTLEALARALGVSPTDLAGRPIADVLADPATAAAHATIEHLEQTLSDINYGDAAVSPRPWPEVAADLHHLNSVLRPSTDYAGQGAVLPRLIAELQALVSAPGVPRRDVLIGLMQCYHSAVVVTRNLGVRGVPALAALHARRVAEELAEPSWLALAAWLRVSAIGGGDRARARSIAERGIADLHPHLGSPGAEQMAGALHLQAALAGAATRDAGATAAHLDEATALARPLPDDDLRGFGALYFGPENVTIWRMSMAVELGEHGRAVELAQRADPTRVPSAARRAVLWSDLGRALAHSTPTRDDAVAMLRRAEDIAPVYVRTRPLVRETITHLMQRARRDERAGRELRGMAYRMGLTA